MTPCPGACNREWRAAEAPSRRAGVPNPVDAVPGQPIWCGPCRDAIADAFAALPALIARIGSGRLPVLTGHAARAGGPDVHASPSPAFDLRDEVERWGMSLAAELRHHLDVPAPRRDHPRAALSYLAGSTTALLSADHLAVRAGTGALYWRRHLERVTAATTDIIRVPGPCRSCDARGRVTRRDGSTWATCGACGATWDTDTPA